MSVRARILALRLLEKQNEYPEYAKQIGIEVKVIDKRKQQSQTERVSEEDYRNSSGHR